VSVARPSCLADCADFRDGGGYYLDVGCSKLIGASSSCTRPADSLADGKIKIKQGVEIQKLEPNGVRFKDGSFLEADIVVMALGYGSMRDTCAASPASRLTRQRPRGHLAQGRRQPQDLLGHRQAGRDPHCLAPVGPAQLLAAVRQLVRPGARVCGADRSRSFQARTMSKHVALQIQMAALGMVKATKDTYPEHKVRRTRALAR